MTTSASRTESTTVAAVKTAFWPIVLMGAAMMMVTMGARQTTGLYLSPLNTATGLGIVTISFAMAVGQLMWGVAQPVAGAIADKYGPGRVLAGGLFLLAAGMALTPLMTSGLGLVLTMGILSAIGAGAGSFSVLIGAASQRLQPADRPQASGIINAGGSFGQLVFAPLVQRLISTLGWMGAMWTIALISLAALPVAFGLRKPNTVAATAVAGAPAELTLGQAIKQALADKSYWCLHAGFFTCGFHIAFLVTHLPGEVSYCGLPSSVASWALSIIGGANILGSLFAGWCVARYRSKYILFWMYGSRAVLILAYLAAPKTDWTFYIFAAGLGFTWLATVPPTAGIVGKLFGVRYLATLFGLTLLSHQIGGFFGAWLGGLVFKGFGNYNWMWFADIALAVAAALINLPIKENKVAAATPAPARPATT